MKLIRSNYPQRDLTPEHTKRGEVDHASEGDIHPEIIEAYHYVDSIVDTSDDDDEYAWYGWAIREAFLAGISYAKNQNRGIT